MADRQGVWKVIKTDRYMLFRADCFKILSNLTEKVDLILTDIPYGTTGLVWDKIISMDKMWEYIKNILKPLHACVLFGAEPFSSQLRVSNLSWFKYDWVWIKNRQTGFVNAKLKPMNKHELISVFSEGKTANCNKNNMPYYPQDLVRIGKKIKSKRKDKDVENTYWRPSMDKEFENGGYEQEFTNYPNTILNFDIETGLHPTQKPVPLLEYLIKTYTLEGETVLDFTMGSGSTGVACMNTNRKFIGIEKEDKYFQIAYERIKSL